MDWLDRHFADQAAEASDAQRAAVARYQGMDRFYERINDPMRHGRPLDGEAAAVLGDLAALLRLGTSPDMVVFKGVRSLSSVFGTADPAALIGMDRILDGLLSTTVVRDVATAGFLSPRGALLELRVAAGLPAIWVPPLGHPALADQGELLFGPGHRLRVIAVDGFGAIVEIGGELS